MALDRKMLAAGALSGIVAARSARPEASSAPAVALCDAAAIGYNVRMDCEWDDAKAAANSAKHGVTFTEAQTVFADPFFIDFYDPDHSDDEARFLLVGRSVDGRLLIVCYTERDGRSRLISARLTTRQEQHDYEEGTA
jgi:uncharacterized DUF497 family protein